MRCNYAVGLLLATACGRPPAPRAGLQVSQTPHTGLQVSETLVGEVSTGTVSATAPDGWSERELGVPLTTQFETYAGADGVPMFNRGPTRAVNEFRQGFTRVESQLDLAANVNAWKVLSADVRRTKSTSYVMYRVEFLDRIVDVDDVTQVRSPPKGAAYYPSRLVYGWSYEFLLYGDSTALGGDLSAKIKGVGGGIEGFVQKNQLGLARLARGFTLKPECSNTLFGFSESEMAACFTRSQQPSQPIRVEYRRLKGTGLAAVTVRVRSVEIASTGCEARCPLSLGLKCRVNGRGLSVPLPPVVEAEPVKPGDSRTTTFGEELLLAMGDKLECGTDGTIGPTGAVPAVEFAYTVGAGGIATTRAYPRGTITAQRTDKTWRVAVPNVPGSHTIEYEIAERVENRGATRDTELIGTWTDGKTPFEIRRMTNEDASRPGPTYGAAVGGLVANDYGGVWTPLQKGTNVFEVDPNKFEAKVAMRVFHAYWIQDGQLHVREVFASKGGGVVERIYRRVAR